MSGEKKSGFVALLGATNSGKSTLINRFVRRKISIVSHKVQTTRMRLYGITVIDNVQLIFVDTPGLFAPRRRLDRAMISTAFNQGRSADKIAFLLDAQKGLTDESIAQLQSLAKLSPEKILLINKVDLVAKEELLVLAENITQHTSFSQIFFVSALTGEGCDEVLQFLSASMPVGPWLYPEGQISDLPDVLLAAEVTREKILARLHQELPYFIHVEPEKFEEKKDKSFAFHQLIYIRRTAHKKIVLGARGATIKSISLASRRELEKIFNRKVHLFLYVKLHENWMEDRSIYASLGLDFEAGVS